LTDRTFGPRFAASIRLGATLPTSLTLTGRSGTPLSSIGVDAGSTLSISGAILGPNTVQGNGLIKLGSGVLELGGTTANQILGDVSVYAGTLRLNKQADVLAFNGNVVIAQGTMVIRAGTPGSNSCANYIGLGQCVVAADLLGDAVLRFDIVAGTPGVTIKLPAFFGPPLGSNANAGRRSSTPRANSRPPKKWCKLRR
jgi:autotransporter-associated beta strand protein